MALPYKVKTLDTVEATYHTLYKKSDAEDSYVLDVEGVTDVSLKDKLNEFRNNNIALFKEKEALEAKLKDLNGIDPVEYKKLKELGEKHKDSKLLDDGKLDEILQSRTERMRSDFMNQIKALSEKITASEETQKSLRLNLGTVKIDNTIQAHVNEFWKIKPGSMRLIINEGRQIFSLDDNNEPVAVDKSNGGTMVGKDGVSPLTIREWVENLPNDLPFLFEEGEGIGSKKGAKKGGSNEAARIKAIKDPQERLRQARKAGIA